MRLIDGDDLLTAFPLDDDEPRVTKWSLRMTIEHMPTIDAEPIRHGHWTYLYDGNYKCSECGSWWTCEVTPIESGLLYCPNCGAKMDEEGEQK